MFRFSVDISKTPLNNIVLETQFMTLTFPLFNCKLQVDFYHTTTVFPNFLDFHMKQPLFDGQRFKVLH